MSPTSRQPSRRRRRSLAAAVVALVAAALALTPLANADETTPRKTRIDLPASGEILWTKIAVRAKPTQSARVVRVLNQFRPDFRRQYVLATREHVDARNRLWYRITLPGRPNGRSGWVSGYGLSLAPMRREIRIDRSARRLELWQGDKRLVNTKVAVGARGMETPLGLFYVTWKFVPDAPILGAYAFETSAYSRLSDWPGGGIVGIHGTPWPWLLGQAVSHGCVRVHNVAINKLRRLVPVGTPIRVVA
jgi:lipoprotein-anchoring transpeptidase ErfK/SrfK